MKLDLKPGDIDQNKLLSFGAVIFGTLFFITGLTDWNSDVGVFLIVGGILSFSAGIIAFVFLRRREKETLNSMLNAAFFELVKENAGKITVFDFAMKANLEPNEAREFIEQKSIQFGALTDIDDEARIIYIFK